jgi:uncharacterized protein YjbI with pentapeptide repeats
MLWLLLTLAAGWAVSAQAQRNVSLTAASTNQNAIVIGWHAQSATPAGDTVVMPQFQVQRSADLAVWSGVGDLLSATNGQNLTFTDTTATMGFYRVNSIIDEEYAEFDNLVLNNGELQFADFFGASFFGASVQNASLGNANLEATDLRSANLTGTDLTGADLFGVNAFQTTFDSGSMAEADARFGDFEAASMFNVDLTDSDFSSAILTGADLDYAVFNGMQLDTNTVMDAKHRLIWQVVNQGAVNAVLTNEDLSFATLSDVSFNGAKLNGSTLFGSFLDGTDLRGANFSNCNVEFIDFQDAQMDGTTIIGAEPRLVWQLLTVNFGVGRDLHSAIMSNAYLVGADFTGANLTNAVCTSTLFDSAVFGNANLTGVQCASCQFNSAILTNANLTAANFINADFTSANLLNAITNRANFSGATFSNTIMPDGSIRNF